MKQSQRGSIIVGIIIGVVIGLAAALAVAVYVTKVPVPFLNRGTARSAEQDAAETRKNRDWDPNAPLYGRNPAKPLPPAPAVAASGAPAPAAPVATVPAPAREPAAKAKPADPLGEFAAARSGGAAAADPFFYFVQAGAFRTPEDAEAQRAKLSLMGIDAKVTEREQSGRQVFRVRVGPFDRKEDADRQKEKLESGGFETALVRVQR
ncbi:SPOR domain-containing protein [Ramlibacter sp.]|uniref:SPOR domain-containing protein n=1 Tax=Ramlibacter sp. TaxID=1917967 RepID=UPI002BA54F6E|nr:SPOR domain-containing protein [Ramlibacter sp.]HWI82914.1 SPOR domain-containing protein [Ramlibacter sp.]